MVPVQLPAQFMDTAQEDRRVLVVGLACLLFVAGFVVVQVIPRIRG